MDRAPVSGKDLVLGIDMELQNYGELLMSNKVGSIVMIEPKTGEILCMVSSPTYNAGLLTGKEFSANYRTLEENPYKPLINRAVAGTYPPGSTFKPTQGLIFLQEGVITRKRATHVIEDIRPWGAVRPVTVMAHPWLFSTHLQLHAIRFSVMDSMRC